uniref:Uncharacterized protein n=1 Tax=Oryza barthii TaxID=65489 RepID=A0A0D3GAI6_9ORYZ
MLAIMSLLLPWEEEETTEAAPEEVGDVERSGRLVSDSSAPILYHYHRTISASHQQACRNVCCFTIEF